MLCKQVVVLDIIIRSHKDVKIEGSNRISFCRKPYLQEWYLLIW